MRRQRWMMVRAGLLKERVLRRLAPSRMSVVPYNWPLLPELCPCDVNFCSYLSERRIARNRFFHFGSGGHHLIGLCNWRHSLQNEILAVTASPAELRRYVRLVTRDHSKGKHYKVLFADIYDLGGASLPTFDVVTLFHLCEFAPSAGRPRRMDDAGVLELFRSKLADDGRLLFYEDSFARPAALPIIEGAVADGRIRFEERYKGLVVFRKN